MHMREVLKRDQALNGDTNRLSSTSRRKLNLQGMAYTG